MKPEHENYEFRRWDDLVLSICSPIKLFRTTIKITETIKITDNSSGLLTSCVSWSTGVYCLSLPSCMHRWAAIKGLSELENSGVLDIAFEAPQVAITALLVQLILALNLALKAVFFSIVRFCQIKSIFFKQLS